jgi:hypothetical protein
MVTAFIGIFSSSHSMEPNRLNGSLDVDGFVPEVSVNRISVDWGALKNAGRPRKEGHFHVDASAIPISYPRSCHRVTHATEHQRKKYL